MQKYIFCLVLTLLSFTTIASAQNAGTIIGSIPFELTTHNNIVIEAVLNDTDTLNLMFHTAASSMTLITARTERINSIIWNSDEVVESWGGQSEARYSKSNSLRIESFSWDSLAIWESERSGPASDGKFGPNLFEGQVIEIDFEKRMIFIHNALPKKVKRFKRTAIEYENDMMFINGLSKVGADKYDHKFLIHSGYGGTILYDDNFVVTNNIGKRLLIIAEDELKDSYGNILKTKKAKLPVFSMSGVKLKSLPVGFFEGSIGRQQMSVIGGDVLKRFHIIIDANRNYLYLKPNSLRKLPYKE